MATRADYRSDLRDKMLGLEDGGYGDFDFTDAELNTQIELAVAKLYPHIYKVVEQAGLTPSAYGTLSQYSVTPTFPSRVFLVVDALELEPVGGWRVTGTKITGLSASSNVTLYYHTAYTVPNDDVTDIGMPSEYQPLVVLGALIEACESRQDVGVRGDEPPQGQFVQTQLLDRLIPQYERLVEQMSMALPAVTL